MPGMHLQPSEEALPRDAALPPHERQPSLHAPSNPAPWPGPVKPMKLAVTISVGIMTSFYVVRPGGLGVGPEGAATDAGVGSHNVTLHDHRTCSAPASCMVQAIAVSGYAALGQDTPYNILTGEPQAMGCRMGRPRPPPPWLPA